MVFDLQNRFFNEIYFKCDLWCGGVFFIDLEN